MLEYHVSIYIFPIKIYNNIIINLFHSEYDFTVKYSLLLIVEFTLIEEVSANYCK